MSAALQLPLMLAAQAGSTALPSPLLASATPDRPQRIPPDTERVSKANSQPATKTLVTWAFYRKHTENLLRRYLYASMQIGRSPNLLGESVGRGWVSSRKVRTFEDALIFVLDVERCLKRLSPLEQQLISRILLQEYTHTEAAVFVGLSVRSIGTKLPQAIDRLTECLVEANLLTLPD